MEEYISKAKITNIKATSRASVKIKDNFYTVEYSEERMLPIDDPELNITREREILWDTVNTECDAQIEEIYKFMSK